MLGSRLRIVYDAGPASSQHWANASCFLGQSILRNLFGLHPAIFAEHLAAVGAAVGDISAAIHTKWYKTAT